EELSWFSLALSGSESPFTVHPIPVTHDFFQNKIRLGDGGVYDAFLSIAALYVLNISNG
ncbi:MAG: hypothetical protein JO026_02540, partial [Patescibacteria group bacterium]|nr:hypothetical protein [Patescibacteria group bacterium]